jgi:hypothetical protein
MELSTRTRRALSTALAVFLAVETVTAVAAAAATRTVTHELPAAPPAGAVLAVEAPALPVVGRVPDVGVASPSRDALRVVEPAARAAAVPEVVPEAAPAAPVVPAAVIEQARAAASASDRRPQAQEAATEVKPERSNSPKPATSTPKAERGSSSGGKASYEGTNRVWIPALGISRSVRWFPCERSRPPDNFMYRWGCAGANNVYLMGHAYSVMEPLHDAYVSGRLSKGMKAWYADPNGRVRVYAVRWWKVVRPTTDAAWAWAAQDTPSMTLQTCVGKNSEFRLMVRLAEVGG